MYKSGVYAIPYEGEEVRLHWANADQYYIKTGEYLRHYTFRSQTAGREGLVLDEWFTGHSGFADEDGGGGYDLVYVNGDNNLENLKAPADTWTVRLIEEAFHRLMFEPERR